MRIHWLGPLSFLVLFVVIFILPGILNNEEWHAVDMFIYMEMYLSVWGFLCPYGDLFAFMGNCLSYEDLLVHLGVCSVCGFFAWAFVSTVLRYSCCIRYVCLLVNVDCCCLCNGN